MPRNACGSGASAAGHLGFSRTRRPRARRAGRRGSGVPRNPTLPSRRGTSTRLAVSGDPYMTDDVSAEGPSRLPSKDPRYRRMAEWHRRRQASSAIQGEPPEGAEAAAASVGPVITARYRPKPLMPPPGPRPAVPKERPPCTVMEPEGDFLRLRSGRGRGRGLAWLLREGRTRPATLSTPHSLSDLTRIRDAEKVQ